MNFVNQKCAIDDIFKERYRQLFENKSDEELNSLRGQIMPAMMGMTPDDVRKNMFEFEDLANKVSAIEYIQVERRQQKKKK